MGLQALQPRVGLAPFMSPPPPQTGHFLVALADGKYSDCGFGRVKNSLREPQVGCATPRCRGSEGPRGPRRALRAFVVGPCDKVR